MIIIQIEGLDAEAKRNAGLKGVRVAELTAEQMSGETVHVPPSAYADPPEIPPQPDLSVNDRARQIAAYANKCRERSDGYEDDVALYALNHLLLAIREKARDKAAARAQNPPVVMPKSKRRGISAARGRK